MKKQPAIYIVTNKLNTTFYTGVTSDLIKRIYQHKQMLTQGFTKRYRRIYLVHYELYEDMLNAISREKQTKSWSRNKKIALIEKNNPQWNDLYQTLL